MSDEQPYVPSEEGVFWFRHNISRKKELVKLIRFEGVIFCTYFDEEQSDPLDDLIAVGTFYPGPLVPPDFGESDE